MDGMLRKDVGKFKGKFMKLYWNMETLNKKIFVSGVLKRSS